MPLGGPTEAGSALGLAPSGNDAQLGLNSTPNAICVSPTLSCSAGTDIARVTLSASAPTSGTEDWPAAQVLFVLETTAYDGAFDWFSTHETWNTTNGNATSASTILAGAICSSSNPYQLCGEANSVGAFVSNASVIAESIQAAHPATRLSFGLVDYFATHDQWGNANGSEYHVDVGDFVPAEQFQSAVNATLLTQVLNGSPILRDSGLAENFLHSSSITALYGALSGAGIAWAPDTHHVIVWIGSTVPRDSHYVVNYCVGRSAHASWYTKNFTKSSCYSPSCEPSYNFTPTLRSPECEGWATSQNGNASDSIAAYASAAPACVNSLGGNCTIDTIEVPAGADWAGVDNIGSAYFWSPNGSGQGWTEWGAGCQDWGHGYCTPDGVVVTQQIWQNVNRTRDASCNLALATGGSWDGPRSSLWEGARPLGPWPRYWTAPETCAGYTGDLQEPAWWGTTLWTGPCDLNLTGWPYCDRGTEYYNETNPTLLAALSRVSLGTPPSALALRGAADTPLFTFVPYGAIQLAPYLDITVTCQSAFLPPGGCDSTVTFLAAGTKETLGFNWSADPNLNVMPAGATWQASLNVIGVGPPFGLVVPVDACTASGCAEAGSGPVRGMLSRADYTLASNGTAVSASFPLAEIVVENSTMAGAPPSSTPPAPPSGGQAPPLPAPTPLPLPVVQPIPVASVSAMAVPISIPAAAAGILIAGLSRILLGGRAVAMPLGVKAGPMSSAGRGKGNSRMGDGPRSRFEE